MPLPEAPNTQSGLQDEEKTLVPVYAFGPGAEQFTGIPGVMVPLEETIRGFKMILSGEMDKYPEQAFLNVGTIDEAIAKGEKMLQQVQGN